MKKIFMMSLLLSGLVSMDLYAFGPATEYSICYSKAKTLSEQSMCWTKYLEETCLILGGLINKCG